MFACKFTLGYRPDNDDVCTQNSGEMCSHFVYHLIFHARTIFHSILRLNPNINTKIKAKSVLEYEIKERARCVLQIK